MQRGATRRCGWGVMHAPMLVQPQPSTQHELTRSRVGRVHSRAVRHQRPRRACVPCCHGGSQGQRAAAVQGGVGQHVCHGVMAGGDGVRSQQFVKICRTQGVLMGARSKDPRWRAGHPPRCHKPPFSRAHQQTNQQTMQHHPPDMAAPPACASAAMSASTSGPRRSAWPHASASASGRFSGGAAIAMSGCTTAWLPCVHALKNKGKGQEVAGCAGTPVLSASYVCWQHSCPCPSLPLPLSPTHTHAHLLHF